MAPEALDERLMAAWQAGDLRAFEALVRRHRGPLFNFLLRFVGRRETAEDLVQEAFLKMARHGGRYDGRARVRTWLFTIGRNLALDALRRERLRRAPSLDGPVGDGDGALLDRVRGGGPAPDRGASSARLVPVLEAALASLPDEQREVFVLREYAGVPFKDIARITDTPEPTVKSRMRYALQGLRRFLEARGVGPEDVWDPHPVAGELGVS